MSLDFLSFAEAPPPPPTAAYSHAVRANGFLFVTGQLGVDPKSGKLVPGGTEAEARQVMRNLETVLKAAGSAFEQVTMARIYLIDFAADYPAVNRIYAECFKAKRFPARTTIGVTALALGARVEVDLVARA